MQAPLSSSAFPLQQQQPQIVYVSGTANNGGMGGGGGKNGGGLGNQLYSGAATFGRVRAVFGAIFATIIGIVLIIVGVFLLLKANKAIAASNAMTFAIATVTAVTCQPIMTYSSVSSSSSEPQPLFSSGDTTTTTTSAATTTYNCQVSLSFTPSGSDTPVTINRTGTNQAKAIVKGTTFPIRYDPTTPELAEVCFSAMPTTSTTATPSAASSASCFIASSRLQRTIAYILIGVGAFLPLLGWIVFALTLKSKFFAAAEGVSGAVGMLR